MQFGDVVVMGRVRSSEPDEISGLGASRLHPGVLYGLNDHGDTNRIFAMDPVSGEVKATLTIANVKNVDWEDICVGTCGSVSVCERVRGGGVGGGGRGGRSGRMYVSCVRTHLSLSLTCSLFPSRSLSLSLYLSLTLSLSPVNRALFK